MNAVIYFIGFLADNALKVSVIIFSVILCSYSLRKTWRERRLNSRLRLKQRMLRNFQFRSHKQRWVIWTSAIVLPVIFLFAFIFLTRSPQTQTDNYMGTVEDTEEIVNIYQRFNQNFSANPLFSDQSTVLPSVDKDMEHYFTESTIQVPSLDVIKYDEDMVFILRQTGLYIVDLSDIADGYLSHQIQLEENFFPKGLFIDHDRVVVLGNVDVDGECHQDFYYCPSSEGRAVIYIFDRQESYEKIGHYRINGYLSKAVRTHEQIIMVINNRLELEDQNNITRQDVEHHLPMITVDEEPFETSYDRIRYVEGSNPNAIVTFMSLGVHNGEIKHHVMLTDINHTLFVSSDAIYMVNYSYRFKETTEHFVLAEPVLEVNTVISKFFYGERGISYYKSTLVQGQYLNESSFNEYNNTFKIITSQLSNSSVVNRIHVLDEDLNIIGLNQGHLGREHIKSVRFVGDYAYIATTHQDGKFYIVDFEEPTDPVVEVGHELPEFPTYLHRYYDHYFIGIDIENENHLAIRLYDFSNKKRPEIVHSDTLIYQEVGVEYDDSMYLYRAFLTSITHEKAAVPIYTESVRGLGLFNMSIDEGFTFQSFLIYDDEDEDYFGFKGMFMNEYLVIIAYNHLRLMHVDNVDELLYEIRLNDND